MSDELRRSPLAHREPVSDPSGQITLAERPFMGFMILRGDAGKVAAAAKSTVGVDLPTTAGTFSESEDNAVMWLSPDEWVIITRPGTEREIMADLQAALSGTHSQVVDVTDYYTAISVGGTAARDVLAKTAMIDLHPRSFKAGHAVASTFGHAGAWLQLVADEDNGGPAFSLTIRRSMADYMWCLLTDAGREFGLERATPIGQVKLHLPHFEG